MNNVLVGGDGLGVLRDHRPAARAAARVHAAGHERRAHRHDQHLNTPIEALERAFPMRVLALRPAAGERRRRRSRPAGTGIERDLLMLEDVTVSLITERRVSRPWGLAGGAPGAVGENWLLPGGDEAGAERLPDKCTMRMRRGDVLRMLTPGGGGWGVPPR